MSVTFPAIDQVTLLLGPCGCGKTTALLERAGLAADRLHGDAVPWAQVSPGATPSAPSRLVVCANASAAAAVQRAVAAAGLEDVAVATPLRIALAVLATPGARSFTCRNRLLLPFEEDLLLEDMRMLGVKDKRLREMMKFFDRMDSEGADEEAWLESGEEATVRARLRTCLEAYGAVRETEAAALAVRYLQEHPAALAACQVPCVLADNFESLSRASQLLVSMLAAHELVVTADPLMAEGLGERYPYPAGVVELAAANPRTIVHRLCSTQSSRTASRLAGALIDTGALPAHWDDDLRACSQPEACEAVWRPQAAAEVPEGSFEEHLFVSPEDEVAFVADEVARAVANGARPSDIAVAGFRTTQMKQLSLALEGRGVPVESVRRRRHQGNVLDPQRCASERALALLALVADAEDATAWRSMIGCGDSLGRSWVFEAVRREAAAQGLSFVEGLRRCAADDRWPSAETRRECEPAAMVFRVVDRQRERLAQRRGRALLDGVAQAVTAHADARTVPVFAPWIDEVSDEASAAELYARAAQTYAAPSDAGTGVRLGGLSDLAAVPPRQVFLLGFVNGFTPPRRYFDKTACLENEARSLWESGIAALYPVVGGSAQRVVATAFTRMEPEQAQRADVHVARIRVQDGRRVCLVEPSCYFEVLRLTEK